MDAEWTEPTPRPRRAPTTLAAAAVMLALSGYFATTAIRSLTAAADGAAVDLATQRELSLLGMNLDDGAGVFVITGGVVLLATTLAAAASLGLLARRSWGREATGFFAFVFAFIAIPLAIGGLRADPPAPGGWEALAAGTTNIVVLALVLVPRTADDILAAEHWRGRREGRTPRRRRRR